MFTEVVNVCQRLYKCVYNPHLKFIEFDKRSFLAVSKHVFFCKYVLWNCVIIL